MPPHAAARGGPMGMTPSPGPLAMGGVGAMGAARPGGIIGAPASAKKSSNGAALGVVVVLATAAAVAAAWFSHLIPHP